MPQHAQPSAELAHAIAAGMPKCPLCGGQNVRRSENIRFEDMVRGWFNYRPFRCRRCQHRFYKRFWKLNDPATPDEAPPTGQ